MRFSIFSPPNEYTCAAFVFAGTFKLIDAVGSNSFMLQFGVPLVISLMAGVCRYVYTHLDALAEKNKPIIRKRYGHVRACSI